MNSLDSAAQFLGMPSGAKPTRRGRGKAKPVGSPASHLANLTAAHKSGDHAATRSHAFKLIRSLPAPVAPEMDTDPAPSTGGATPPMPMSAASPPSGSGPPLSKPPSGLSKLAGMLSSRKTR